MLSGVPPKPRPIARNGRIGTGWTLGARPTMADESQMKGNGRFISSFSRFENKKKRRKEKSKRAFKCCFPVFHPWICRHTCTHTHTLTLHWQWGGGHKFEHLLCWHCRLRLGGHEEGSSPRGDMSGTCCVGLGCTHFHFFPFYKIVWKVQSANTFRPFH